MFKKVSNPDSQDITLYGKTITAGGYIVVDEADATMLQQACSTFGVGDASEEEAAACQEKIDEAVKVEKKGRKKKIEEPEIVAVEVPTTETPEAVVPEVQS